MLHLKSSAFPYQVKCEKYWPDECNSYGEIKVTTTKSRAFADYVTRTFRVEKVLTTLFVFYSSNQRSLCKFSYYL